MTSFAGPWHHLPLPPSTWALSCTLPPASRPTTPPHKKRSQRRELLSPRRDQHFVNPPRPTRPRCPCRGYAAAASAAEAAAAAGSAHLRSGGAARHGTERRRGKPIPVVAYGTVTQSWRVFFGRGGGIGRAQRSGRARQGETGQKRVDGRKRRNDMILAPAAGGMVSIFGANGLHASFFKIFSTPPANSPAYPAADLSPRCCQARTKLETPRHEKAISKRTKTRNQTGTWMLRNSPSDKRRPPTANNL